MGTANFDFDEEVVIVTGGSSGIGRATALEFGRAGATVIVADVRRDPKDLGEDLPTDEAIADLGPRRFVLGDPMFFGSPDPEDPLFDHGVDGETVGMLVDMLTDVGFVVTDVERVHDQVGVLVAERRPEEPESDSQESR